MRVLGIFDLSVAPSFLGCGLMFLEELSALKTARGYEAVDLVVVADGGSPPSGVLNALLGTGVVEDHFHCAGRRCAEPLVERLCASHAVYPTSDWAALDAWDYDSSLRLQAHFRKYGSLPALEMRGSPAQWAERFVAAERRSQKTIAVHLKSTGGPESESNADFAAWHAFFSSVLGDTPVRFVLIGNDPIPDRIIELPTITVSRDAGAGLPEDLALIQAADGFMGMVSGPFNMALFGRKPYVAFKHPAHHADAMMTELGSDTTYPFAAPGQRILRVRPDAVALYEAFEWLMDDLTGAVT